MHKNSFAAESKVVGANQDLSVEDTQGEVTNNDTTSSEASMAGDMGSQDPRNITTGMDLFVREKKRIAKMNKSIAAAAVHFTPKRIRNTPYDRVIQIVVGPSQEVFEIHRGILCNLSAYFRAAIDGKFKEAQDGRIILPVNDPEIFERFQLWAYRGTLLLQGQEIKNLNSTILTELYIFAEARDVPTLQNAAVDALIQWEVSVKKIPTNALSRIYANTRVTSPIRRLVVDMSVNKDDLSNEGWFLVNEEEEDEGWPREFLFAMARRFYDLKKAGSKGERDLWKLREKYYVSVPVEVSDMGKG